MCNAQKLIKMKRIKLSVAESTRIETAAKNRRTLKIHPIMQSWNMRKRERAGTLYIGDAVISYVRYCKGSEYRMSFTASEWPF